jgi:hypothetical protein
MILIQACGLIESAKIVTKSVVSRSHASWVLSTSLKLSLV